MEFSCLSYELFVNTVKAIYTVGSTIILMFLMFRMFDSRRTVLGIVIATLLMLFFLPVTAGTMKDLGIITVQNQPIGFNKIHAICDQ
jgi:hypothetical protein